MIPPQFADSAAPHLAPPPPGSNFFCLDPACWCNKPAALIEPSTLAGSDSQVLTDYEVARIIRHCPMGVAFWRSKGISTDREIAIAIAKGLEKEHSQL